MASCSMKWHSKVLVPRQAPTVAALALAGILATSCAASRPTLPHRPATVTSGTQPASTSGTFEIAAPAYLSVHFAPHACIGYPALGHAKGVTIFIDPGHGGADSGAKGASSPGPGVDESTANLAIALDLLPILRNAGYQVVLSRTADTSVASGSSVPGSNAVHLDNEARLACANAARANILISIHMNGFGDPSVGGAETIYDAVRSFAAANAHLAELLQSDILAAIRAAGWSVPDRGVQTDSNQGTATPGAPPDWKHLFLLGPAYPGWNDHPSQIPGALIEPVFVTDRYEDGIVASQAGDRAIASGIAKAVEAFDSVVAPRAAPRPMAAAATGRSVDTQR